MGKVRTAGPEHTGRPSEQPGSTTESPAASGAGQRSVRRCRQCGRAKDCPRLICATGHPTCRACAAANRREGKRKANRRRNRPCSDCGGPKQPGVGRRYCDACLARRHQRRCKCGAAIGPRRRTCDTCKRERKRKANLLWNMQHREAANAAQRRYYHRHPERARAATQRWYAHVRQDPEAWARLLESHRMGARLRAERNGHALPPVPEHRYPGPSKRGALDPAPVRKLVREWMAAGGLLTELADVARVSERLLGRLLGEEQPGISLMAADRIVVALGLHLDLIYEEATA